MIDLFSGFLMLLMELTLPFSRGPLEGGKNLFRVLCTRESWSLLLFNQHDISLNDYWLRLPRQKSQFVMHALGDPKAPNTLAAARSSVGKSASLFEVDIFLDSASQLRCHHGPEPPRLYEKGDCTLSGLAGILPKNSYIILDLKTDFVVTANAVLDQISNGPLRPHAKKLIFQLYLPSHLRWFEWAFGEYPGLIKNQPIVTLYRTHSRAPFIARVLPGYVAALTFPYKRGDRSGLEEWIFSLDKPYYVHPVKS